MNESWQVEDSDTPSTAEFESALEKMMSEGHEANVILTGYIIQAVGVTAEDSRDLVMYRGKAGQSGIVTQGLLNYITFNAEQATWGEDDDD